MARIVIDLPDEDLNQLDNLNKVDIHHRRDAVSVARSHNGLTPTGLTIELNNLLFGGFMYAALTKYVACG